MITATNVSVRRNGRMILDGVSCEARAGEVLGILGANGAGKSTFLRVLSGEVPPVTGHVNLDGKSLADWKPADLARRRAVVPQESALRFPYRVIEVVEQGRSPHLGRPAAENERAVWAALEAVGLSDLAERDYTTLSGGERQRVHLARAFAQLGEFSGNAHGQCLLLDEPTASLDLRFQHETLRLVRQFAGVGGCVVVVLHDLNLCAAYADRALILARGQRLAAGSVNEVMTEKTLAAAYGISVRTHVVPDSRPVFSVK